MEESIRPLYELILSGLTEREVHDSRLYLRVEWGVVPRSSPSGSRHVSSPLPRQAFEILYRVLTESISPRQWVGVSSWTQRERILLDGTVDWVRPPISYSTHPGLRPIRTTSVSASINRVLSTSSSSSSSSSSSERRTDNEAWRQGGDSSDWPAPPNEVSGRRREYDKGSVSLHSLHLPPRINAGIVSHVHLTSRYTTRIQEENCAPLVSYRVFYRTQFVLSLDVGTFFPSPPPPPPPPPPSPLSPLSSSRKILLLIHMDEASPSEGGHCSVSLETLILPRLGHSLSCPLRLIASEPTILQAMWSAWSNFVRDSLLCGDPRDLLQAIKHTSRTLRAHRNDGRRRLHDRGAVRPPRCPTIVKPQSVRVADRVLSTCLPLMSTFREAPSGRRLTLRLVDRNTDFGSKSSSSSSSSGGGGGSSGGLLRSSFMAALRHANIDPHCRDTEKAMEWKQHIEWYWDTTGECAVSDSNVNLPLAVSRQGPDHLETFVDFEDTTFSSSPPSSPSSYSSSSASATTTTTTTTTTSSSLVSSLQESRWTLFATLDDRRRCELPRVSSSSSSSSSSSMIHLVMIKKKDPIHTRLDMGDNREPDEVHIVRSLTRADRSAAGVLCTWTVRRIYRRGTLPATVEIAVDHGHCRYEISCSLAARHYTFTQYTDTALLHKILFILAGLVSPIVSFDSLFSPIRSSSTSSSSSTKYVVDIEREEEEAESEMKKGGKRRRRETKRIEMKKTRDNKKKKK